MHAASTFARLRCVPQLCRAYHSAGGRCCHDGGPARFVSVRRDEFGGSPKRDIATLRVTSGRIAARRGDGEQRFPVGEYGERIVVSSYEDQEEDDDEDEFKLEYEENGCVLVKSSSKTLEEEEDDRGGFLCCDFTGCYFSDEPPVERAFEVIEGEGWRLGYETAPESVESFCAIVGAGGWSLALTASEFNDFCYLIQILRNAISTVDEDKFLGKDEVVIRMERGCLWMACVIPKKRVAMFQKLAMLGHRGLLESQHKAAFELRFILSGVSGRRQVRAPFPYFPSPPCNLLVFSSLLESRAAFWADPKMMLLLGRVIFG